MVFKVAKWTEDERLKVKLQRPGIAVTEAEGVLKADYGVQVMRPAVVPLQEVIMYYINTRGVEHF